MINKELTPGNSTSSNLTEKYTFKYNEIRKIISGLRKQGKDMFIPDNMLRGIPSKIQWAAVSKNKEDLKKIDTVFDEVKKEIEEASLREIVDYKKDLQKMIVGEQDVNTENKIKKDLLSEAKTLESEEKEELSKNNIQISEKDKEEDTQEIIEKEQEEEKTPQSKVEPEKVNIDNEIKEKKDTLIQKKEISKQNDSSIKKEALDRLSHSEDIIKEEISTSNEPKAEMSKKSSDILTGAKLNNLEKEYTKVVDPSKRFFLKCGSELESMADFENKLLMMPEDCFEFHAKNNDFYNWIKEVFNLDVIAEKIKGVSKKAEMIRILQEGRRGAL